VREIGHKPKLFYFTFNFWVMLNGAFGALVKYAKKGNKRQK
jgi:hypothetical protein